MSRRQSSTTDWDLEAGARLDEARACVAALTEFLSNSDDHNLPNTTLSALSCAAETLLEQADQAFGRAARATTVK